MRTLLRVIVDNVSGNKALSEGSLPKLIQSTTEKLRPEAVYFLPVNGKRSFFMIFDMKDSSEMPGIVEPFYQQLNAKVEFCPVMNAEDLQKGLGNLQNSQ
jgi:hypothetical protein